MDEWGRVWKEGMYLTGVVETAGDLKRYQTQNSYAERFFDAKRVEFIRSCFPDHCLFFGTHIGPVYELVHGDGGWTVFAYA